MKRIAFFILAFLLIASPAYAGGIGSWFGGPTGGVVTPANSQKQVVSPAYPNSTSPYVMQGLAGLITPARSGNVLILISGTITASNNTIAYGVQYQISYGTSTAPTSNSALAGTQVGTVQKYENQSSGITAADVFIPFSTHAVVTGLTVGTAYWIDLAAESIGAVSDVGFSNVSITVIEQ